MKIGAAIDDKAVVNGLAVEAPAQLPYVAAATLSAVAGDAAHDLQGRAASVFDRPVDFTVRGFGSKRASAGNLESQVYVPGSQPEAGKAPREYMRPETMGTGARYQKKTEFLLARLGALPIGWVTVPGKGAQLDAHGNVPGSVYKQIINVLQLRFQNPKAVSARSRKAAAKLGVSALYFVAVPGNRLAKGGGRLPPGVWKHLPGHRIAQVLHFVQRAGYKPRLDLLAEAEGTVKRQLALRWREASIQVNARFLAGRK